MLVYDIAMLVILLGAVILGAWKGMVWQLAPIASLLGGYFVAFPVSARIAHFFGSESPLNRYIAMLVLFLVTSLAIYMVARFLREKLQKMKFTEYDRHLGALLGGVKGLLLCVVLTFFVVGVFPDARKPILSSKSGYSIAVLIDHLHGVMPEDMHDTLHPYLHTLDQNYDHQSPALERGEEWPSEPVIAREGGEVEIPAHEQSLDPREMGREILGDVTKNVDETLRKTVRKRVRNRLGKKARELGVPEEKVDALERIGTGIIQDILSNSDDSNGATKKVR